MEFFDGSLFPLACFENLQCIVDKVKATEFIEDFMVNNFSDTDRFKFDKLSSKLKGEARIWYFDVFSELERNKIKPLQKFLEAFKTQYVDIENYENLHALYEIYNILKQHNETVCLLVDKVSNLETTLKEVKEVMIGQVEFITPMKAEIPSFKAVVQRVEKLEGFAKLSGKPDSNSDILDERISCLVSQLEKVKLSKNDSLKSLKRQVRAP